MKTILALGLVLGSVSSAHAQGVDLGKWAGSYAFESCRFSDEYYEHNSAPHITGLTVEAADRALDFTATGDDTVIDYRYSFSNLNEGELVRKYKDNGDCYVDRSRSDASERAIKHEESSVYRWGCNPLFSQRSKESLTVKLAADGTLVLTDSGNGIRWAHTCTYKRL